MTQDDLARLQRRVFEVFQQEVPRIMQGLIQRMVDPSQLEGILQHFARSMGVDFGQLAGMVSQHPGFDPYAIFHLDKSASDEEVKQAYRKVMTTIHPDKAGPELTTLAAIANAAYKMIEMERGWQ